MRARSRTSRERSRSLQSEPTTLQLTLQLARQLAVIGALIFGLSVLIATSPIDHSELRWDLPTTPQLAPFLAWPLPDEESWSLLSEEELSVAIEEYNNLNREVERREVMISQLKPTVHVDCELVMERPLDYLRPDMFADPRTYSIRQGDLLNIETRSNNPECHFLYLVRPGVTAQLVSLNLKGKGSWSPNIYGIGVSELPYGTILLEEDSIVKAPDEIYDSTYPPLLHAVTPWSTREESDWSSCESDEEQRLNWSVPESLIFGQLSGIRRGVDGCHELYLTESPPLLVCMPWELLETLDRAWWIESREEISPNTESLTLSLYTSEERFVEERPAVIIEGFRDWQATSSFIYPFEPLTSCELIKSPCRVTQRLQVALDDLPVELDVEDGRAPIRLPDLDERRQHWLLAADRHALVDTCGEEEDELSDVRTRAHTYIENVVVTDLREEAP